MGNAHQAVANRWVSILVAEGIDDSVLDGKQHPCPVCAGKDRFRFDDKGEGRWYCNHCGAGDGYSLLCKKFGYDFKEAKARVEKLAGVVQMRQIKTPMPDHKKRELMNKTWNDGKPDAPGLRDYLLSRGIPESLHFNPTMRWHPDLLCTSGSVRSQAILIKCYRWGIDGKPEPVTIQRHWPNLGTKMMMPAPIKLDGIFCPLGGRPTKGQLGVCEGYITALSCMALQPIPGMMPVWPTMSAEQLVKFLPPPEVKMLYIYIDVDCSFTGQAAGYALAKRLRTLRPDLATVVSYPTHLQNIDYDFNDLLKGKDPWPAASSNTAIDADAATASASPVSHSLSTLTPTAANHGVINATKDTTGLTSTDQTAASMPEKPVDAGTTVSLIGEVHFTAHKTLDSPRP